MRVCQFRHDGNMLQDDSCGPPLRRELRLIFYRRIAACQTFSELQILDSKQVHQKPEAYPSSFALIVIFAFSTFDTGQPLFAFSAAFVKAAWSALGT
jgi:hypothetical protein